MMRFNLPCVAICGLLAGLPIPIWAQAPTEKVRLQAIPYQQLTAEVQTMRGNVVLVDFWGSFCPPCKQKFPNVVALHQRYSAKGLKVVSVTVDSPEDADSTEAAYQFLVQQKATFRNVQLTDHPDVWQSKLKSQGVPLMYLFDREGKLIQRWEAKEIDFTTIEKRIQELLVSGRLPVGRSSPD